VCVRMRSHEQWGSGCTQEVGEVKQGEIGVPGSACLL